MRCTYCKRAATQEARDEYHSPDQDLAWMPICDQCIKLDEWHGVQVRPLGAHVLMTCCNTKYATVAESIDHECTPDHFHVIGTKGFHPNNAWHHHRGSLYTMGGSAYSFNPEQLHACYTAPQPYGRCASF